MNKKKKNKKWIIIIVVAVILVAIATLVNSFVQGFREPVVSIDGNRMTIETSLHGVMIDRREIESVSLIDVMPTVTRLGGGFEFWQFQRAPVRVSNLGEGLAYIRTDTPPFIFINLNNTHNYIFINLDNSSSTRTLYARINEWLQEQN